MARWTGGRILPITASASPAWIFRSAWDRTMLPLPFAKVEIAYGKPIDVPSKLSPSQIEEIRLQVEKSLLNLQDSANEQVGFIDHEPVQAVS